MVIPKQLVPKNWTTFQHYKDRSPPWIRLHHSLLDNRDFHKLDAKSSKALVLLWLIASESKDGTFTEDATDLSFRLRMSERETVAVLDVLKAAGFLCDAECPQESIDDRSAARKVAEKNGFGSRHIPNHVRIAVWNRDGGRCCQCSATENIEYDHKQPVSSGGNSEEWNLQLLCRRCNRKKRTSAHVEQVATHAQAAAAQPEPGSRTAYSEAEAEAEAEAEERRAVARKDSIDRPADVTEAVWSDWIAHRKRKRASVTALVIKTTRASALEAGMTLDAALAHWVAQGHVGFYPPDRGPSGSPRPLAKAEHPRNTPIGATSCECDACKAFRAKRRPEGDPRPVADVVGSILHRVSGGDP